MFALLLCRWFWRAFPELSGDEEKNDDELKLKHSITGSASRQDDDAATTNSEQKALIETSKNESFTDQKILSKDAADDVIITGTDLAEISASVHPRPALLQNCECALSVEDSQSNGSFKEFLDNSDVIEEADGDEAETSFHENSPCVSVSSAYSSDSIFRDAYDEKELLNKQKELVSCPVSSSFLTGNSSRSEMIMQPLACKLMLLT